MATVFKILLFNPLSPTYSHTKTFAQARQREVPLVLFNSYNDITVFDTIFGKYCYRYHQYFKSTLLLAYPYCGVPQAAKSYPQYQSPYTHETSPTHAYTYAHLYIIKVFGEKHKKNNGTIFFSSSYFHIDWNVCNISKFTKFYSECDKVINGDHIKWHLSI